MKGERESPCLMPQEGEKVEEGDPLTKIEKREEELRERTYLIQIGENPKEVMV
jgi:hypothetical protein